LLALGLNHGDTVAVLGFNRHEWTVMAHAAMMIGGRIAGVYWTSAPEEVVYIVNHARCPLILVEDAAQLAKLGEHPPAHLRYLILMRGTAASTADGTRQITWEDFLARGNSVDDGEVDRRISDIQPADLGALIYTSGTTGHPKAVMLSHAALAWTAQALVKALTADARDRTLSYLPLAHIAEQMVSVHAHALGGYQIHYAQSLEALGEHLKEVHPTIFFGVPRVWERMQKAIEDKLNGARGIKAILARSAMSAAMAWQAMQRAGRRPGTLLGLQRALANRLVLGKVKTALGFDQARWLYSGAAPISPATLEFFSGLDLSIREVYGLSESCGPTALGLAADTPIGSVGQALAGLTLRIADDGEVMVAGPAVFSGYAGMQHETESALQDGWLATGDLGKIDEQGNLFVTGRKKDLLITSGGKNFSPANLEADLMNISLVEHAVVCGDGRHFLSVLLTLRSDILDDFCARNELHGEHLHRHPVLLAALQAEIDRVNARHARSAGIRKFTVLEAPLSIEGGELTPTLKIRRQRVMTHFNERIEAMYQE
jgi:long-chain acyl-CoA synthetase